MRHLVLTSDGSQRSAILENVLLGEWCRLKGGVYDIDGADKSIPYHWLDPRKMELDYRICEGLYEKYLEIVSCHFEKTHQVGYGERYWQRLAGRWLRQFIEVLYDRYECILAAEREGRDFQVNLPPEGGLGFELYSYVDERCNLRLFAEIIRHRGVFRVVEIDSVDAVSSKMVENRGGFIGFIVRNFIEKAPSLFARQLIDWLKIRAGQVWLKWRSSGVLFVGQMYLDSSAFQKLARASNSFAIEYHGKKINLDRHIRDDGCRTISYPSPTTDFECFLQKCLSREIPSLYLEAYKAVRAKVLEQMPRDPKVVLTCAASYFQPFCDFMIAEYGERGVRLLSAQHGGNYGSSKVVSLEDFYLRIFERYYPWGVGVGGGNVRKMPAFRLINERLNPKNDSKGPVLLVANSLPRFKSTIHNGITGSGFVDYIKDVDLFLSAVSADVKGAIVLRAFANEWGEDQIYKKRHPWVRIVEAGRKGLGERGDFEDQVVASRLSVHTVNETTYLQCLAANKPVVVFFSEILYELKPGLRNVFDLLKSVGIFHSDGRSAAEHVNSIFFEVENWWFSDPVQLAVKKFTESLAYTSKDWLQVWSRELKEQMVLSGQDL